MTLQLQTGLALLSAATTATAATITTTTIQHAGVTNSGATADGEYARMATQPNNTGLDPQFLVTDFQFGAGDFGFSKLNGIATVSLTLTPKTGPYTIGVFTVFYVENNSPSIDTGSTDLFYSGVYTFGFDTFTPPPPLSGLTTVSSGLFFDPAAVMNVNLDVSSIEADLIDKINNGEKIRFIISEGGDNTTTSWHGLGSDPALAPKLTINASGIPEPGSTACLLVGGVGLICRRKRWVGRR